MPLQGGNGFDVPPGNDDDIDVLGVPLAEQLGDEWCWAACAQMVRAYYGQVMGQCAIASKYFDVDCCAPPPDCDDALPSDEVAVVFDKLNLHTTPLPAVADFPTMAAEIAANRPVLVGLLRDDGGAHLVVVVGAGLRAGRPWVKYNDPLGPVVGSMAYDDLLAAGAVESWIGVK